ncbi:dihydrofolate reductase family protein [Streptomyces sp. NBC_01613]|uniref:dihydrofolate reductase family protein n=1 Tax=Streptomyces sp. NBC_01613 TaxID=2975896 RepID=UPI0038672D57
MATPVGQPGCGPGWDPAAGDVMLHGASTAHECLRAGLLDELEIRLVQVLLGEGSRLFDAFGPDHVELELLRRLEARDVTHLRYRMLRG